MDEREIACGFRRDQQDNDMDRYAGHVEQSEWFMVRV